MTQLQVASVEARNLMIGSLMWSLNEDKSVLIVVPQGVVPILIRLLNSTYPEMRAKVLSAISRVSSIVWIAATMF